MKSDISSCVMNVKPSQRELFKLCILLTTSACLVSHSVKWVWMLNCLKCHGGGEEDFWRYLTIWHTDLIKHIGSLMQISEFPVRDAKQQFSQQIIIFNWLFYFLSTVEAANCLSVLPVISKTCSLVFCGKNLQHALYKSINSIPIM